MSKRFDPKTEKIISFRSKSEKMKDIYFLITFIIAVIFIGATAMMYFFGLELSKKYDTLERNYNDLEKIYNEKNSEYLNLQYSFNELNSGYASLKKLYDALSNQYSNLEKKYYEKPLSKSLSDIPTSSTTSLIDFSSTPAGVLLESKNLKLSSLTDTKSMLPTISAGHTAIYTTNFNPNTLQVGDIISYKSSYSTGYVIHRIIDVKSDYYGICYTIQGDNNPSPDPECVRPSQIEGLVVGVIYDKIGQGVSYCADVNPYTVITPGGEIYCYQKGLVNLN